MICLTFDTDWMPAEHMDEFLNRYPSLPASTFFRHSSTNGWVAPLDHETGPHPTLTSLTTSSLKREDYEVGIRSHSCVSSHMLSIEWANLGYQYQSTVTIPWTLCPQPWRTAWGIWELPISYMDNQDFWFSENWPSSRHDSLSRDNLRNILTRDEHSVLDFHPLHIALNTRSAADYARKKLGLSTGESPWSLATSNWGVRDLFEYCLDVIEVLNVEIGPCRELVRVLEN